MYPQRRAPMGASPRRWRRAGERGCNGEVGSQLWRVEWARGRRPGRRGCGGVEAGARLDWGWGGGGGRGRGRERTVRAYKISDQDKVWGRWGAKSGKVVTGAALAGGGGSGEFGRSGPGALVRRKYGTERRPGWRNRSSPDLCGPTARTGSGIAGVVAVMHLAVSSHFSHFRLPVWARSSAVGGVAAAQARARSPKSVMAATLGSEIDWWWGRG